MIATLLILGGTVFGVLGALHAVYTLLDLHNPRDDLSLSILRLHTRWRILCSDYREDARTCGELGLALTLATALAAAGCSAGALGWVQNQNAPSRHHHASADPDRLRL